MRPATRTVLGISLTLTLLGLAAAPGVAATAVQRLGFCGGDDWEPAIAAAGGGYVYVLITHYTGDTTCDAAAGNNNSRIMIQVSTDGGSTFGAPAVVSDTPGGIAYPSQADPA